ncbi:MULTISPECIES: VOC family protein [unclassified Streptomyces]|uniref:VOC family protein n=1 Tax=unclassified Streptomyces TaxID=2593676 RepID=UPI000DB9AB01|nr:MULTISPECIES: VOC family protein [unclassified Streptomyces]MYT74603.1 VOC family protein [Streptomyces sp. SID8367]RAJ91587.1 glyoxalase-like protein [Streptomyces sp. PsTaAH-137]
MATSPPLLDHLVLATPDLAATVADFTRRSGVTPAPGGAHVGLGTRNHLVGLGGSAYLEIVGPDPEQPEPARPRPFGIDRLTAPAVVTWAIRPPVLDATVAEARAAGTEVGPVRAMSRRRPDGTLLEWRLTLDERAGVVPFLIDWGTTAHPSAGLPSVSLRSVAASAPDPAELSRRLVTLGTALDVAEGPAGLTVRLDTPAGTIDLP